MRVVSLAFLYSGEVSAGTPLVVTFNANATAVQALVRNLTFRGSETGQGSCPASGQTVT